MFKVCGIIVNSNIELLCFPGTERVKKKKLKISKACKPVAFQATPIIAEHFFFPQTF